jgi:16S rRNA (cytosine1407-C5)-methyltransferase
MKPTRTFRITGQEHEVPGIEALLRAEGFDFAPLALHPKARILHEEPFALGRSLAARLGLIYIQDISSMVPPLVLAPHPGDVVLDLCASPGSKTGMLAEAVGASGMVVANEPSPRRLATLRANMRQIGAVEVVTTSFARFPRLPSAQGFPRILVDAPCSGWGTAHKHPEVLRLWREEKTQTLESLQRALLARAAEILAPGGLLVYSTCTTNTRENEAQISWAEDALGLRPQTPPTLQGIALEPTQPGCLRVVDRRGQGFFVAMLRKNGPPSPAWTSPEQGGRPVNAAFPDAATCWDAFTLVPRHKVWDLAPKLALLLSADIAWRGLEIGRHGKNIAWNLGCRRLESLVQAPLWEVDDPRILSRLLAGESFRDTGNDGRVKIFFHQVFVGWATRRAGRLMWINR